MWEFFLCLLPSLTLVLLQMNWIRHLAESAIQCLGCFIWTLTCRLLKLSFTNVSGSTKEKPEVKLICKPTALASYLRKHCHALTQPPTWPQTDPHLQIITNLMWPTLEGAEMQGVRFTRDHLLLHDGGIVALDWAVGLSHQDQIKRQHHPGGNVLGLHSSNAAIVILIPNALGRVTPNLLKLCHLTLKQGFYPVVFHRRGHGGCPLTTPRYQEFGNPSDLMQTVCYLRNHHPSSTLLAVSEGSGSGLLLSYLGECGSSSYLMAAACISPVFHGQLWFENEFPWLYHWVALIYRKFQINRYATSLSSVMDVANILSCKSLRDMEEFMFCTVTQQNHRTSDSNDHIEKGDSRISLKPDWAGYWDRNEPLRDADEVAIPVLCLYSTDDPLFPPSSTLPETLFHNNPYFLLAQTEQGGHCGFMHKDERGNTTSWSHSAVLGYFHVVADFFGLEDKKGFNDVTAMCCSHGLRRSVSTRRSTLLRKERPVLSSRRRQISTPSDTFTLEEERDDFTWNRSYTR
ncbi:protein ABHD15 [Triplophysa rosa]|uniref:Abhydrolase domain-containing protein 15-like n=1 Tax=Triplophysa rosa TaxID=992332 RepID=A0A9W7TGR1_TRIRA|nr:protein ABHD15 [Triplophysa rosa]KAI7796421.1 putative abhydrolase domain-containing protein 15-like [Triplophysa rosa]